MPSNIIEEALYTEQINALRIDWRRLDDALITLMPALLKVPDVFPVIPGTRIRRVKILDFDDVPPISIFFTIKGSTVHLLAAELIDYEE
jgi:hypothetical protein